MYPCFEAVLPSCSRAELVRCPTIPISLTALRSRPRRQWIHIRRFSVRGSPATSLPADPVSSTPIAATSTGSAFRAAKAAFPSQRTAVCCGVSDEQESGVAAGSRTDRECRCQAVAECTRLSGSPSLGQRVLRPAQRSRTLSFARWQIFHEQFLLLSCAVAGYEACTQSIAYTDGSACMTREWPRLTAEAGWGAVIFAVDASVAWRLAGGTWGPLETDPAAQLFLGASRPTSPVTEVTAIASVLRMLRAARVSIPLTILSAEFSKAGCKRTSRQPRSVLQGRRRILARCQAGSVDGRMLFTFSPSPSQVVRLGPTSFPRS